MPYRHAHLWLLALFPLIVIAFWPNYFGDLAGARPAQHAHGMTATAWLILLTVQSWSAHARRLAWHRAAGQAVFVVVPAFVAAGVFGVHDMAARMAIEGSFESFVGAALAPDDVMSIVILVGFVAAALVSRRRIGRHGAWMLATALLVLPPMTARLIQVLARSVGLVPPSMWVSFLLAELVTVAIALAVAKGRRDDAKPFLVLVALTLVKIASYPLLESSARWRAALAAFGNGPVVPSAATAAALSLGALLWAWRSVPPRPKVVKPRTSPGAAAPRPSLHT